jgi:hypothetical protein
MVTATAGGELLPFERPGTAQPLTPAAFEGAMAGWTHTRRLEQVERYEPITPAATPAATAHRPGGPTPQLATAVANMWELVKGAGLLGLLVLAGVMLWLVARGVLWVA